MVLHRVFLFLASFVFGFELTNKGTKKARQMNQVLSSDYQWYPASWFYP